MAAVTFRAWGRREGRQTKQEPRSRGSKPRHRGTEHAHRLRGGHLPRRLLPPVGVPSVAWLRCKGAPPGLVALGDRPSGKNTLQNRERGVLVPTLLSTDPSAIGRPLNISGRHAPTCVRGCDGTTPCPNGALFRTLGGSVDFNRFVTEGDGP